MAFCVPRTTFNFGTGRRNDLMDRRDLRELIDSLSDDNLLDAYAEVSRAQAVIVQRLSARDNGDRGDELEPHYDVPTVARALEVTPRWVREHRAELGCVELSSKCLRFPRSAILRYLEARRV